MAKKSDYIIQYSGLKLGSHEYSFEVNDTFFSWFEWEEARDSDMKINLIFEKSETMLVLNFEMEGSATTDCDLCLEDMQIKLSGKHRQIVKISDYEEADPNEEVMVVPTGEHELDVSKMIFDLCFLSFPTKKQHPEGECDEEALEQLSKYLLHEEHTESTNEEDESDDDEIDPRWNALKGLK